MAVNKRLTDGGRSNPQNFAPKANLSRGYASVPVRRTRDVVESNGRIRGGRELLTRPPKKS